LRLKSQQIFFITKKFFEITRLAAAFHINEHGECLCDCLILWRGVVCPTFTLQSTVIQLEQRGIIFWFNYISNKNFSACLLFDECARCANAKLIRKFVPLGTPHAPDQKSHGQFGCRERRNAKRVYNALYETLRLMQHAKSDTNCASDQSSARKAEVYNSGAINHRFVPR
jgi:hypothetical protein